MSVFLLATLDTKGEEADFVRARLREIGIDVTLVDTGCQGEPTAEADIDRQEVFTAAGTTHQAVLQRGDRGEAVTHSSVGTAKIVAEHYAAGSLSGVLAIGGSAGTTIGTAAMRALPLGVPKLMVSTLASGNVRPYVGDKDILMLNSVVDILGLNRISRSVFGSAAAAMAGMIRFARHDAQGDRPLIAATMFGVTTPCVEHARRILENAGYEVLVFHATGNGGQAMESLIRDGVIRGVLDITTTELADEIVGGILSAGPDRLTAAGAQHIPQVVSVGATDMVNFGPRDSVPQRFESRQFYEHNPTVTLMRTTEEENEAIGRDIGQKMAKAKGATAILLPALGVSAIDRAEGPFDDPASRNALFDAIELSAQGVEVHRLDHHINDPQFAEAAARKLLDLLETGSRDRRG